MVGEYAERIDSINSAIEEHIDNLDALIDTFRWDSSKIIRCIEEELSRLLDASSNVEMLETTEEELKVEEQLMKEEQ